MFFTFSYQNGNDYNVCKKPRKRGDYLVCVSANASGNNSPGCVLAKQADWRFYGFLGCWRIGGFACGHDVVHAGV